MGLLSYGLTLNSSVFDRAISGSRGLLTGFDGGVTKAATRVAFLTGSLIRVSGVGLFRFTGGLNKAATKVAFLTGSLLRLSGQGLSRLTGKLGGAAGKLSKLTLGLSAVLGPAAAVGLAFKSINLAADLETTELGIRNLVGEVQLADQTLSKVHRLASTGPFTFAELGDSTRKLLTLNETAQTIPSTLRLIGEAAAGAQTPIADLAEEYGKARKAGVLSATDIEAFTSKGIPVQKEMASILGVQSQQIAKLADEGKITFPLLEQSFINLTSEGGKFHNMMAQKSATTNGLLGTLKESTNQIFLAIGQPLNDVFKPILSGAIDRSKRFGIQLQGIIELFREAGAQGKLGSLIGSSLQLAGIKFINTVSGGIRGSVAFLGAALSALSQEGKNIIFSSTTARLIKVVFSAVGDLLESKILGAAARLAEVLKIPFASEIRFEADFAAKDAKVGFLKAKNIAQFGDFEKDGQNLTDALDKSFKDGAKAYAEASSVDLIDEKAARKNFTKLSKSLNPKAVQKILDPSAFIPKPLDDSGKRDAPGLVDAIDTATKVEKTKSDQNVAALNKNTGALARTLTAPRSFDPKSPLAGGSVFSQAETLAKQFGKLDKRGRRGRSFNQFINDSIGGRRAVRDFARKNEISLPEARRRLVELAGGAAPGQGKKPAGQDPRIVAAKAMLDVVKNIDTNLENIAVA